jgi:nucleoside-diphosphate-sugar epimerase
MKSTFKNILITGGAGYIGTMLTQKLLKKNFRVKVLDSLRFNGESMIPFFSYPNFEFIKGDVRVKEDVEKALKNIDAVIHLAAIVGFPACRKDPELSYDINVNGTKNLVNCVKGKYPIFFASTNSVYGKMTDKICTEETALHPLSEYGEQKKLAEKIIKKNKKFVIYRFATAFGVSPRMRLDLMPNDFVYRAVK